MRFDGIDYAALFAAGACQYASEMGMSEKDAEAFAEGRELEARGVAEGIGRREAFRGGEEIPGLAQDGAGEGHEAGHGTGCGRE